MEEARETLAKLLGARPSEVIFTAGGTESDNLAVKGIYWARRDGDLRRRRIVTTPVEHHAVLDAVEWLVGHEGADVTWLPVEADGSVLPSALREALQDHDDVALVTVMWANNEVGTIMPIAELAAIAAEFDVPMHSDAVQYRREAHGDRQHGDRGLHQREHQEQRDGAGREEGAHGQPGEPRLHDLVREPVERAVPAAPRHRGLRCHPAAPPHQEQAEAEPQTQEQAGHVTTCARSADTS